GATLNWLHCHPAAERKGRLDGDAVDADLKVGARETIAMDITRDCRFSTEGGVDLLPIDLLGIGGRGKRCHAAAEPQHQNETHFGSPTSKDCAANRRSHSLNARHLLLCRGHKHVSSFTCQPNQCTASIIKERTHQPRANARAAPAAMFSAVDVLSEARLD